MPNMQERLESAVTQAENDVSKLHNIINGSDTQIISTEGGNVPSVAKKIKAEFILKINDQINEYKETIVKGKKEMRENYHYYY